MSATLLCDYCRLPVPRAARRAFVSRGLQRSRVGHRPASSLTQGRWVNDALYCCYGCSLAAQITQARGEKGQAAWLLTRLGVSVFLSMGVMVFSLAMYGQEVYGLDLSEASPLAVSLTGLVRYLLLVLATPVFLLLGLPILSNALRQLRAGIASTDALVVVGVGAAFLYSYIATVTDSGKVYYETACMILILVTLGRYLEAAGKLKASASVEGLHQLIPTEVSIRRGQETLTVASDAIRVGDRVLITPGQRIAVDGTIEAGRAHVDEQLLTGESRPTVVDAGDPVRAGTVAVDGALTVRATAVGSESSLGRLITLLDEAKKSKGRYERLADRVASFFVPVTIALAAVGALLGYRRAGADEAILSGLAVLLISCPCALGIATPLALWVSLGRAASGGTLFRNGETIEALACVRAMGFDKTGTLTTGAPAIASFVAAGGNPSVERKVLSVAAGLAMTSTHPLARSVAALARRRGVTPAPVTDARAIPGRGIVGSVRGATVRLGNQAMMEEASVSFDEPLKACVGRVTSGGAALACVGEGSAVSGVFAFSETLRGEASDALTELKALGLTVEVLTGDHPQRGAAIAASLGALTHAALTPDEKITHLKRMRRERGPVAMVGDGLNDAPALTAADVGIAMGCGADISRESAAVCLLGNDLRALPGIVRLARKTVRTIKLNLFWAFFYNVLGMSLAIAGKLSPIFAAAAMVASSLLVVMNSLKLGQRGARGTVWGPRR